MIEEVLPYSLRMNPVKYTPPLTCSSLMAYLRKSNSEKCQTPHGGTQRVRKLSLPSCDTRSCSPLEDNHPYEQLRARMTDCGSSMLSKVSRTAYILYASIFKRSSAHGALPNATQLAQAAPDARLRACEVHFIWNNVHDWCRHSKNQKIGLSLKPWIAICQNCLASLC